MVEHCARESNSIDPSITQYREFMAAWPTGISVVTASDADGYPHGMVCNSLCSLSASPPSLLVSLHEGSGTLAAIRCVKRFCVNFLTADRGSVSTLFSSSTPDRFDRISWRNSPIIGLPWLMEDSYAFAECDVSTILPAYDHLLVIGDVRGAYYSGGRDPLVYYRRQYRSIRG